MTYVLHVTQTLSDEQLKAALSELVDKFLHKMMPPENQISFEASKEKIVEKLFQSLLKKDGITFEDINNPKSPNFINNLVVHTIAAVLVERNLTDDLKELLKKLKELNPDFEPEKINQPGDLEKLFTKEQLKLLLTPQIVNQLKTFYENFRLDVKNTLTPLAIKPELVHKNADEVTYTQDPYVNLLGLMNSRVAGTIPVPIVSNKGNTLGVVDQSAQHGLAPIDATNRLDTSLAGDPLGLIDDRLERLAGVGSTFAVLIESMHNHARLQPPKPTIR